MLWGVLIGPDKVELDYQVLKKSFLCWKAWEFAGMIVVNKRKMSIEPVHVLESWLTMTENTGRGCGVVKRFLLSEEPIFDFSSVN